MFLTSAPQIQLADKVHLTNVFIIIIIVINDTAEFA